MPNEDVLKSYNAERINEEIKTLKIMGWLSTKDLSDTYHTFDELYTHRMALTVALCHTIDILSESNKDMYCYKSWKHNDGTMFDGMFIVVIETPHGQISYHYNAEHWDKFKITAVDAAHTYDGHTPADTIDRLLKLYKE